jgi:hypothetical protein
MLVRLNPQTRKTGPDVVGEFFGKFGDHLPKEMSKQREQLAKRLG